MCDGQDRHEAQKRPAWDVLFEVTKAQARFFTTRLAAPTGYPPRLFAYLGGKKVARVRRGFYRLVHFPASEHEQLVVLWLRSGQTGVVSHETALPLHHLSDVLPGKVHLAVPTGWRLRHLRIPAGLVLHRKWRTAAATTPSSGPATRSPQPAPARRGRRPASADGRPGGRGRWWEGLPPLSWARPRRAHHGGSNAF